MTKIDNRVETYSPVGTKFCQGICDRDIIYRDKKPIVVCNACKRVVMDSRNLKK
jgi:hypothetical protein